MRRERTERSTRSPAGRHAQALAAQVARVGGALDEARTLEPLDVAGHARRRDPLERGESADADPGIAPDQPEQRRLAAGHAERVRLAPQLAAELEQDGPEPAGDVDRARSCQFVNHVNEFTSRT